MKRKAKISRKTKETSINVEANIDGKGKYKIDTGIGFLDHMLEQLSKHSLIDLNVKAKGDTSCLRKCLEPFFEQFSIHFSKLLNF